MSNSNSEYQNTVSAPSATKGRPHQPISRAPDSLSPILCSSFAAPSAASLPSCSSARVSLPVQLLEKDPMEVAAYRELSVLGRKHPFGTCKAKTDVSSIFGVVGNMPETELVRQPFRSELVATRELLEKANAALSSPSSPLPAPRVVKDSRQGGFLAAEPRSEEPPAKKIKASPSVTVIKRKKVTRGERDMLAAGLAKLASELPDNIMELLKKHSRGISAGEMEIDINSVPDEAILELQRQFDEFVRARAADPSPQENQDGGNVMVQEEDEDVDILGGVSPLAIAPEQLQLAEDEEEYVDICGDASPVVMPKYRGDDATASGIPSQPKYLDSESDEDESVGSQESQAERDATLLIASAKEYHARCRAREKARQEVLETERTAMPGETIHPTVFRSLRIVEYDYDMAIPYSLLPRLGLFLKDDDDDDQEQQLHPNFEEELEEGEIRF